MTKFTSEEALESKTPPMEVTNSLILTFSSTRKPEARTFRPSMARQQVNPLCGSGLPSFAQKSAHCGPIKLQPLALRSLNFSCKTPKKWQ
uniref:MEI1 n=1 Tax=Arabidopsis thaliana TaxID=3702 RepID=Q9ZT58_ARATH|nr:MEI1 [Arabidopsis thaliana]